jgi:ribonuclease VapC
MVLDTSALLAILFDEPERRSFTEAIEGAARRLLSAANFVEASLILEARHGAEGVRALDRLLSTAGVEIVPVDVPQAQGAREAFRLFGKGRHPASLNFGDCFAYALAKVMTEPLLFKGNDFSHTDLQPLAPSRGT